MARQVITQAEYAQKVDSIRERTLDLEAEAIAAFREAAVKLAAAITRDVRYTYDQERAAKNLANAAVMIQQMRQQAGQQVDEIWNEVDKQLRRYFKESGQWAQEEIDEMLEAQGEIVIPTAQMQQIVLASQFSADLIKGIKGELLNDINTRIQLGVLGGKSPGSIIADLEQVLPTSKTRFASMERGSLIRAEAIVRTEFARVHSIGQQLRAEQYEAEGIETLKVWHHMSGSAHPRAGHIKMDGQTVNYDEKFKNPLTGEKLKFPQDPAAPASETVNCACWMNVASKRFRKVA